MMELLPKTSKAVFLPDARTVPGPCLEGLAPR